jgi:hypothetical protein
VKFLEQRAASVKEAFIEAKAKLAVIAFLKRSFTVRRIAFPIVWLLYKREPLETRGLFLFPIRFENKGQESVTIFFGRVQGFIYGSATFSINPPCIRLHRKDGFTLDFTFFEGDSSFLEMRNDGVLVLHRHGEAPLVLFHLASFYAIQIISICHRWPGSAKERFRIQQPEQSTGAALTSQPSKHSLRPTTES